jgi:hypothetical protein
MYFICVCLSIVVFNTSWLYEQHDGCLIRGRKCLPFVSYWGQAWFFMVSLLLIIFSSVLCDQYCQCLWLVNSWLPFRLFHRLCFNGDSTRALLYFKVRCYRFKLLVCINISHITDIQHVYHVFLVVNDCLHKHKKKTTS